MYYNISSAILHLPPYGAINIPVYRIRNMHIFLILFFVFKKFQSPSETLEFSAFFIYPLTSAQHPHPNLIPLFHHQIRFDRLSVSHVLVCLIDFIQRIAVREDLARIDLAVKDRLQQDFLVIGRH